MRKAAMRKGLSVGYDIPKFLREAKNGDFSAAADTVGHLFGEVCGAICPESGCRAHCVLHGQGGVDIPSVEREVFSPSALAPLRKGRGA